MSSETWKQVAVYIASGYFDMEGERIELFDRVLPELRQMCVPLRVQLHFIDLRVGLSEHQVPVLLRVSSLWCVCGVYVCWFDYA